MQKIFEYTLDIVDNQVVDILLPAILLSVEEQRGNIVLYAIVDEDENVTIPVEVLMIRTGNPVQHNLSIYKFIGTVKIAEGTLMWHIFAKHGLGFIDMRGVNITEPLIV